MCNVLIVVGGGEIDHLTGIAQTNGRQQFDFARFQREQNFFHRTESTALTFGAGLGLGQIVDTQHHVLRGHGQGKSVRGREDVPRRKHQNGRLNLRLGRERNVHGHLVAVKISIEGCADQRMDADGFALDQRGLEGLDTQAMQRGRAIEKHRMLANDFLKNVPDDGLLLLDHFLGLLDRGAMTRGFQLVVDKGLEKLQSHFFRQTALVEPEFGTHDDYGAAGIVYSFTEQVLAEAALLAFQRIGERFKGPVVRSPQDAAASAIVKQRVDGFLKHALFVAHDDVGSVQLHEFLQAVIAINHAPVEIIEIGGGKSAAIERHQRPQLRRKHGDDVQDHPLGLIPALAEGIHDTQPLGILDALLQTGIVLHLLAQFFAELFDIDVAKELFNGFGAHSGAELSGIFGLQLAEFLFRQELALLDAGHFAGIDNDESLEIKNALQIAHGDIQQVANARRQALEKPHVRARRSQFDVTKALAPHFAEGNFDAALIADHSAMLHALVFAAQTLPIRDRTENLGAKQAIALRFERAVIDGLRLGHFAVGPGTNLFRAGQADANGIEIRDQAGTVIGAATIQGFLPPCRGSRRGAPGRPGGGTGWRKNG